ncbi:MAG: DASS family sodium-coupled anion symporter [candidate division Zixibacteria bacterium]|nr:DASS family sodium-coupled anion symporter [candidate division Zixibacteria bacterium]MBU1469910.1 DASS family sodium-coupled anion symporter [candidate division Zixibacteria bacterium]MBU2624005.1 DASS family sodium-coupled anion symporter [candidate division Zixibacteria bacterium]
MMADKTAARASSYDRYVDFRRFGIVIALFVIILMLPIPSSMLDVAVEYQMGKTYVLDFYSQELFGKSFSETEQWQMLTAQALEACMMQGASSKATVLKRKTRDLQKMGIQVQAEHLEKYRTFIESMDDEDVKGLLLRGRELRQEKLSYNMLTPEQQQQVDRRAKQLKVCIALVAFVVICFVTEAIPLPGVAFCIGLILVMSGIVSREEVAQLFWSDACWFIMGSLMFAAAFVKTGVDKRICLLIFRSLAKPSVKWVTAIMILVISPAASFISDHALAAIFLPIGIILYNNSLSRNVPEDKELAKMLMITIAMACNIGGFGSPSGGARNVIIMTYMEDMFGLSIGYGQWILYGAPFVIIMMPLLWLTINYRFKPQIHSLQPALASLKSDIDRMGGWNRKQILAIAIFLIMFIGWVTESGLILRLTGIRLGIGVIAVAGAMAYLLTGVVNWRDYQEKVDWGVVWLYAGAIIFGRVLDSSGAAYWIARSIVEWLASIGLKTGTVLLGAGAAVTAGMTNLMADGPAAAAVGPITLNMAAAAQPGTTLVPFMGLVTAAASSFAYLLIIGTPPNAIVYSSGLLSARDFLRVGIICVAISFAVLLLLSMFYWPLIGFAGLPSA